MDPVYQTIPVQKTTERHRCATNRTYEFKLVPADLHVIEFEDVLFHTNSAVMMPTALPVSSTSTGSAQNSSPPPQTQANVVASTQRLSGIKALAYVFHYASIHPDQNMLIAGHTDTTGGCQKNFALSELRAQNVRYLLLGYKTPLYDTVEKEGEAWALVCAQKHIMSDYQQILKYVDKTYSWKCDPGAVDNSWGPKTEQACLTFLKQVIPVQADSLLSTIKNDRQKAWPAVVWQEVYAIYKKELCAALEEFELNSANLLSLRASLSNQMNALKIPYVGCGMSFPVDQADRSQYNSQANRRVEIVFLDADCSPKNKYGKIHVTCCSDKTRAHTLEECPIWNTLRYVKKVEDPVLSQKITVKYFIDCHMHTNSGKCAPDEFTRIGAHVGALAQQLGIAQAGAVLFPKFGFPGYLVLQKWVESQGLNNGKFLPFTKHRDSEIGSAQIAWFIKTTTEQMAQKALNQSSVLLTLNNDLVKKKNKTFAANINFAFQNRLIINMPMDLEYLHYAGYNGHAIYEYDRHEGSCVKWSCDKKIKISLDDYEKLEFYTTQLSTQQDAFKANGGELLSFFHYDPRRWNQNHNDNFDYFGTWDAPFKYLIEFAPIEDAKKNGLFWLNFFAAIGFKMYSQLGYRPDDYIDYTTATLPVKPRTKADVNSKLPHLYDFYSKCESQHIPITCHCSRGGAITHESMYYVQCDKTYRNRLSKIYGENAFRVSEDDEYYFYEYTSPFAWENVLKSFPNLRLCLAHIGGEESWGTQKQMKNVNPYDWAEKIFELAGTYPNFYTDLACALIPRNDNEEDLIVAQLSKALKTYPLLKQKILLGTDFFVVVSAIGDPDNLYKKFLSKLFNIIVRVDPSLLNEFLVINPLRFLRIQSYLPKIKDVYNALPKGKLAAKPFNIDWISQIQL